MTQQQQTVIEQLEKRLEEVSEEKHDRVEKGDDVGMAYRSGKEMGLIYAIETLRDDQSRVASGGEQ